MNTTDREVVSVVPGPDCDRLAEVLARLEEEMVGPIFGGPVPGLIDPAAVIAAHQEFAARVSAVELTTELPASAARALADASAFLHERLSGR